MGMLGGGCNKNVRGSGRTTACVRAAVDRAMAGKDAVVVVWDEAMVPMIHDIAERYICDSHYTSHLFGCKFLQVMGYERFLRTSFENVTVFYDHYVSEQLEYRGTGKRQPEYVRVWLDVDGFGKEVDMPVNNFTSGHYRVMMREPLSYSVTDASNAVDMTTCTCKVAEFHRTSKTHNGLTVFEAQ